MADPSPQAHDLPIVDEQCFVHLHLHSQYSLLDGGNRLDRLVERVKALGMSSVAVTDHGNLFGAMEFYSKAKAAGVHAILGIEAYVAPDINGQKGDRTRKEYTGLADGGFHLVLLAETSSGWKNLLKLSSDSYIRGFYYRPRMDKSTLAQWADGLIAINGHLGSSLAYLLVKYVQTKDPKWRQAALEEARWHAQTFVPNEKGEPRFFIELQRHSVQEQHEINPHLLEIARELNLPVVCDNDAHFLLDDDYETHDTLCCISMGKTKEDDSRLRYSPDLYVKSPQQMWELFKDVPESVRNTQRIARRCHVDIASGVSHAPVVNLEKLDPDPAQASHPEGSTDWYNAFCSRYQLRPFDSLNDQTPPEELKRRCDQALAELAEGGAVWRYGRAGITAEIRARLERELGILAGKNISAYFLIVWDFVNEARRRGIPANARGSGVGTMVGYCLGLSNACPVRYGLLFERFTDPDRSEYPDIDIDICQDGRQQIIDYVRQKYGHVAQIITFGTLKARAAIRDVGRVLNVPLPEVDKLCKLVGEQLGTTIEKALAQEPELKELHQNNPQLRQTLDTARRLEGMARHAGVHAAGVVIATQPLDNIVPLYQPPGSEQLVTQWDGPTCEKVGLLKMDFLGLRTLSIIERAKKLIRQTLSAEVITATVGQSRQEQKIAALRDDPLDLERLPFDDPRVFDLFRRAETAGVFQFESGGFKNLLLGMQPDRLEDLIAANAMFRPGPMDLIPDYLDRKHGRQQVPAVHPIVDRYTAESYGVMVYQEQVMQVVHGLGGIPLRAAYTLIKNISKKKQKDIDAVRPTFVDGAQKQGLSQSQANELFELILKFAGYGFNKSHSTGYAIVAYHTAYLKTYFPAQYMAALLTFESVSIEKVVEYVDECRRVLCLDGHRGIAVRPPDINLSDVGFAVVFDPKEKRDVNHGHIRFGLSAVKGVGDKAIAAVLQIREKGGPFQSLFDFCERIPPGAVNRATIEALIKCGAFDTVHGLEKRAALVEALDGALQAGQRAAADRAAGQMSFFGALEESAAAAGGKPETAPLPNTAPFTSQEQLRFEKEVLGFYVSSHPLHQHKRDLERFATVTVAQCKRLAAETQIIVGGMLTRVKPTLVKNGRSAGQKMAMFSIEDSTGVMEGVIFADAFAVAAPVMQADRIVFLRGKIDRRREEPSIKVDSVLPVEQAARELTQSVRIVLREKRAGGQGKLNGELGNLKALLRQAAGAAALAGNSAQVFLEVHQQGLITVLKVDGMRIAVDEGLPARIETVLHDVDCCHLVGPPKLAAPGNGAAAAGAQNRLRKATAADEEFCASIDRY